MSATWYATEVVEPARVVRDVRRQILSSKTPSLAAFVFAPPFDELSRRVFLPRLDYLKIRSEGRALFVCAGYGEAKLNAGPDTKGEFCVTSGATNWYFNPRRFAKLVDEFEQKSKWRYSGGLDVLVTKRGLPIKKTLVFDVAEMASDRAVPGPASLFELICRAGEKGESVWEMSGNRGISRVFEGLAETVVTMSGASAWKTWKRGRHFAVRNLRADELFK